MSSMCHCQMLLVSAFVIGVIQMGRFCAIVASLAVVYVVVRVMLRKQRVSMHREIAGVVLRTSSKKRVEIIDVIHVCSRSVFVPLTVIGICVGAVWRRSAERTRRRSSRRVPSNGVAHPHLQVLRSRAHAPSRRAYGGFGQQPVLHRVRRRVMLARRNKVGSYASLSIVAPKGFVVGAGEARQCHRVRAHAILGRLAPWALLSPCVRVQRLTRDLGVLK